MIHIFSDKVMNMYLQKNNLFGNDGVINDVEICNFTQTNKIRLLTIKLLTNVLLPLPRKQLIQLCLQMGVVVPWVSEQENYIIADSKVI